ncbi:MAG: hypothetical protein M3R01_14365, partial [Actinomycetota bacterium]|nr:hypothetical protein [Actinomycetota bacterium]
HVRSERHVGRPQVRHIALVDLTLLCGAALIAVATSGFGVVMAAVAAFPLLITRFSFQRYAQARETLSQTVQALGLVPELAGLVAIGHSERTATYARAIADELGFGAALSDRIVTASRLKHLGAVPFDPVDPDQPTTLPEPAEVAASGALILREAGFPTEVAELIELSRVGALGHPSPSLEAAVVRVATAFDEVVGEDETAVPRGLAVVSSMAHDANTRRAAAALLEVAAGSGAIVSDAIAVGARFRTAASDLELEDLLTQGMGADVVPFVRRRAPAPG